MATYDTIDPTQTDMTPITSAEDPEFESVRTGALRPYQVRNPTTRRKAYQWWMDQRYPQQSSSPVIPQASAADMVGNAETTRMMSSGGETDTFLDRQAPANIESVRRGLIRPDQIENPTVRASVMDRLQRDPAFAAEFRRNIRAQSQGIGVPADPARVAKANEDLRNGVGVPVPQDLGQSDPHAAIRSKIEERNRMWGESRTARAARMISRMDPRRWDAEIEKFNQRHSGESFLRREDLIREGGRGQPVGFGGYGDAPQIVQPNPNVRVPRGTSSDPNVIQTAYGDHRVQSVSGRQFAVPVLTGPGGASVPNAGLLTREEFDSVLSTRDASTIKRMVYASGQPEWVSQMRKIDSGYAALDSDSLSPQERDAAEIAVRSKENDLMYRWVRSNGHAIEGMEQTAQRGPSGMQEYESPDDEERRLRSEEKGATTRRQVIRRATEIRGDYPDMSDDDALRAAEEEFSGSPSRLYPSKSPERAPKSDFNADRFASEYQADLRRKLATVEKIRAKAIIPGTPPDRVAQIEREQNLPRASDAQVSALSAAYTAAGGETADVSRHRRESQMFLTDLADRYAAGDVRKGELYAQVRANVMSHFPAYIGDIDSLEEADPGSKTRTIRRIVEQIVARIEDNGGDK